jgi:hypothetical protein
VVKGDAVIEEKDIEVAVTRDQNFIPNQFQKKKN